jgi:acetyl-CoA synthetase
MADSQEAQDPATQVSEAQIAVHWREEEYYPPPPSFVAQANANDPAIFDRFAEDKFPDCFKEYADLLDWDAPCTPRWIPAARRSGSGSWAVG